MTIFLLILFGFLAGVVGGLGMGGGTVLVPLLSFLDLPQKTIQAINLVSFLPMCSVALIFHAKNRLVETKHVLWLIVPAIIFAVAGALVADVASNEILRLCFAVFLIAVGIWQLVLSVKFVVKQRKERRNSTPADTGVLNDEMPEQSVVTKRQYDDTDN